MKHLQLAVEEELHWALKTLALQKRMTMKGLVVTILRQTLEKQGVLAKGAEPRVQA